MVFCGVIKEAYRTEKGFHTKYVYEKTEYEFDNNYGKITNKKIGYITKAQFDLLQISYYGDPWKNTKRIPLYLEGNNIKPSKIK